MKVRSWLERELSQQAQRYSALRWLWYLRRLPREIFAGHISTTAPYMLALAEIASGTSAREEASPKLNKGHLTFPMAHEDAVVILEFCGIVRFLYDVMVALRLAGKGANFVPRPHARRSLPQARLSAGEHKAVQLYDKRVVRTQRPFDRVGSIVTEDGHTAQDGLIFVHHADEIFFPIPVADSRGRLITADTVVRFVPRFVAVDNLRRLSADAQQHGIELWSPDAVLLLAFLRLAFNLYTSLMRGTYQITQVGYSFVAKRIILDGLEENLRSAVQWVHAIAPSSSVPTRADAFFDRIRQIGGSLRPLRHGPILRNVNEKVFVDYYAATMRLNEELEYRKGEGKLANVRADHFELAVQAAIDSSAWSPPPELRGIRGKPLRLGGRHLTDIDAVGCRGGVLLAVSCKSVVYSSSYDDGDFRTVRNIASTIEQAVFRWDQLMVTISANQVGDNYDFSWCSKMIFVVCTPHVCYTASASALRNVVPRLRAAVAFDELVEWLSNI